MHVGASQAALSNRPTCIQNLTHTSPLPLAGRGAYTRARPDSPHASRSITAPKSYTTELRAGGCPKPTGRRPTDPQPTIATARANPVESNALNGPTRLTATTPRRVRTGSSQLNLRSDGQRFGRIRTQRSHGAVMQPRAHIAIDLKSTSEKSQTIFFVCLFVVRWTDTHSHQYLACGYWESTNYQRW